MPRGTCLRLKHPTLIVLAASLNLEGASLGQKGDRETKSGDGHQILPGEACLNSINPHCGQQKLLKERGNSPAEAGKLPGGAPPFPIEAKKLPMDGSTGPIEPKKLPGERAGCPVGKEKAPMGGSNLPRGQ